jgi:hypothetical protein
VAHCMLRNSKLDGQTLVNSYDRQVDFFVTRVYSKQANKQNCFMKIAEKTKTWGMVVPVHCVDLSLI